MFLEPIYLTLIPLLILIVSLITIYKKLKLSRSILFSAIFTLLIFSIARPYKKGETVRFKEKTVQAYILLDVSLSMLADDVKPNRFVQAKRKLFDFVNLLNDSENNFEIGLILFSGSSEVFCPLTEDIEILKSYIQNISLDLLQTKGSDISSAINLAIRSFEAQKNEGGKIIIFSDGEKDNSNISVLSSNNYPIYSLLFGTKEGSPIKLNDGSLIKDKEQNIVVSKREEEKLLKLARKTKGEILISTINNIDVKTLKEKLSTEIRDSDTVRQATEINEEYGFYFLILALLVILISFLINPGYIILILLLCFSFKNEKILAETREAYEGYQAYKNGDFKKAEERFKASLEKEDIFQNQNAYASSLYKEKKYEQAKKYFTSSKSLADKKKDKFRANYNLGNANFMLKDFKSAISSYEEALKSEPNSKEAKHNLEIAKKMLKKQQKKDKKKKQEKKKNKEKEKQEKSKQNKEQDNKSENKKKNEAKKTKPSENKKETAKKDEQKLKKKTFKNNEEAKRWLNSLPESPLLLQKNKKRSKRDFEQYW